MDVLLLVAATPTSSGVDWPGDFTMDGFGRLTKREESARRAFRLYRHRHHQARVVRRAPEGPFRLLPYFLAAAEKGRLHGLRLDGIWLHVGTPAAIDDAERLIARSVL